MINQNTLPVKQLSEIDLDRVFLHYTAKSNLASIAKNGLEPRIGINAKVIEKSKKVFFTQGGKGALMIMDVWLKWLIAKPKTNWVYFTGAFLLNKPYFPKFIHRIIISSNQSSKRKQEWAFNRMRSILDSSVYLVLDLEEGVDFINSDIDEVKSLSKYPPSFIKTLYPHENSLEDKQMGYWNMRTISNKVIEPHKISLLGERASVSANDIIRHFAHHNTDFIKSNCHLLSQYLNYLEN